MDDIVILSALRTPIGAFRGALASMPASQLGAVVVRCAVARAGVAPAEITDVFLGNVLQAGLGQAPARQAAVHAGLPPSAHCVTVNKVCGSALESIINASRALAAGEAEMAVAGGMENMSRAPYLVPQARDGFRLGHQQMLDSMIHDGLWDPYNDLHMGSCAEQCARRFAFTREQQDAYAVESFRRAQTSVASGHFAGEIVPVETADAKGRVARIEHDETPAKVDYARVATLKPAFDREGTITAANASSLSDGAAALVLTTAARAKERGLTPLGRIVAFGAHSHEPLWFTTAPISAARIAVERAGWSMNDVDLWEINEAFAVVALAFQHELKLPPEKVNVHGGAIALGHPLGASGARIVVTLLNALRARGARRGVAAICIGGGEGLAVCVELI
jgi:acetyl-CoA C-acetyltransferase